jgi:hypothetical protein
MLPVLKFWSRNAACPKICVKIWPGQMLPVLKFVVKVCDHYRPTEHSADEGRAQEAYP